jgi:hypothetical protein
LLFLGGFLSCSPVLKNNDYLISFTDTIKGENGYKNHNGDIVIPAGKYASCFTDTFRTYAIVAKSGIGFIAIDRKENILYKIFPYDNGPDYPSDGLFRIMLNNKIGYADSHTGKVMIDPKFDCAEPFEKGIAKVSNDCTVQSDGEHTSWESVKWYYIDKTGKKVEKPKAINTTAQ